MRLISKLLVPLLIVFTVMIATSAEPVNCQVSDQTFNYLGSCGSNCCDLGSC